MYEQDAELRALSTTDEDAGEWTRLFDGVQSEDKDIHFTIDYARAYQNSYGYDVRLAVFENRDGYILMPFVLRDLSLLPFLGQKSLRRPAYDMTSLYSFDGPIARIEEKASSQRLHNEFQKALTHYCTRNGIVAQFIAFHPLLENHKSFQQAERLEVKRQKEVVWIDLSNDSRVQFRELSPNHRWSINKARRLGVQTGSQKANAETFAVFRDLYAATMERVGADERWMLPDAYCDSHAKYLGPDSLSLYNAELGGQIISSAFVLRCQNTAYYHLNGACEVALRTGANHLLIHELALWCKTQGCLRLHLGGGLEKDDSLFRFKAGFSNCRSWFYTANIIYDDCLYRQLCEARTTWANANCIHSRTSDFFPAYRR
jgi:GNAT acetyltransferase-like protein